MYNNRRRLCGSLVVSLGRDRHNFANTLPVRVHVGWLGVGPIEWFHM